MIAFKSKKFRVKVERVRLPDGDSVDFAMVERRPGTSIIPFIDSDTILLAYQYRPAVGRWILNLAGGTVEESETPMQNAVKELEEELGYRARRMRLVAKLYPAPYMCNQTEYIFVATGLVKAKRHLERGEQIRTRRIRVRDAIRMARTGRISDAITAAALMMLEHGLK
ncbi:MAG: NUDIX hydrolase [Candidatus Micrarchaeota archaeon]|nr:NUDIX hydrolase [Candidatus Micrarchaeota archaeon]